MGSAASAYEPRSLNNVCSVCWWYKGERVTRTMMSRLSVGYFPYGPCTIDLPCGHRVHTKCMNEPKGRHFHCYDCDTPIPWSSFNVSHIGFEFTCDWAPGRRIQWYMVMAMDLLTLYPVVLTFGFGSIPSSCYTRFVLHPQKVYRHTLPREKWKSRAKCVVMCVCRDNPFFVLAIPNNIRLRPKHPSCHCCK